MLEKNRAMGSQKKTKTQRKVNKKKVIVEEKEKTQAKIMGE
jgi:hypothetical protein